MLRSHRGWDEGALPCAQFLSRKLRAPLVYSTTSRLLVDLNRSAEHPSAFSEFTRDLPAGEKVLILKKYYQPYREKVARQARNAVVHLSVHSFTPVFKGHLRSCDLGVLYDPKRPLEARFARAWQKSLRRELPDLKTHLNLPYRGWGDGLTTYLRTKRRGYCGLELEINQRLIQRSSKRQLEELFAGIAVALENCLQGKEVSPNLRCKWF